MDMTDRYIKMCKEAFELQQVMFNKWRLDSEAFFAYRFVYDDCIMEDIAVYLYIENKWKTRTKSDGEYLIWLPRQDELQEMLFRNFKKDSVYIDVVLRSIWSFWEEIDAYKCAEIASIEQLWLWFIMNKIYNKVWDDISEAWIFQTL